jgi:hypothetical protein
MGDTCRIRPLEREVALAPPAMKRHGVARGETPQNRKLSICRGDLASFGFSHPQKPATYRFLPRRFNDDARDGRDRFNNLQNSGITDSQNKISLCSAASFGFVWFFPVQIVTAHPSCTPTPLSMFRRSIIQRLDDPRKDDLVQARLCLRPQHPSEPKSLPDEHQVSAPSVKHHSFDAPAMSV